MPCRVSFFMQFQGDRLGGWSENFWNGLTPGTALNNAIQLLGQTLMNTKANGVQWTRTRVSIPGSPRNSYTILNNPIYQFATQPVTGPNTADYQVTRWLYQLSHLPFSSTQPGQNSTRQWLGGVPDASIINAIYQPGGPWLAYLNALQGVLTSNANGWIMWQLNPAFPANPIVSINPTTGIVTCANSISNSTAILVRISRVRNLTYANGLWTWQPVAGQPNQIQLQNWVAQTNVMTVSPKASMRPQIFASQPIVSAVVVRASNHRVGRPIGQFGGRRKRSIVH